MNIIEKIKKLKKPNAPWNKYYSKEERNFQVPNKTIYELLKESSEEYANLVAINYFGTKITFKNFIMKLIRWLVHLKVKELEEVILLLYVCLIHLKP